MNSVDKTFVNILWVNPEITHYWDMDTLSQNKNPNCQEHTRASCMYLYSKAMDLNIIASFFKL